MIHAGQMRNSTDIAHLAHRLGVPATPQRRVPTRTPADFIDDAARWLTNRSRTRCSACGLLFHRSGAEQPTMAAGQGDLISEMQRRIAAISFLL